MHVNIQKTCLGIQQRITYNHNRDYSEWMREGFEKTGVQIENLNKLKKFQTKV
jgi:peptidyl-tRNA hydrolase